MPQMSPLWWTLMLFTSTIIIVMIISLTYFYYNPMVTMTIINSKNKLNWKW